MRKLMAAAALLFMLSRCTEKTVAPAPYKTSFDSFELSYNTWVEQSFSLRVDSNKAFICNYGHGEKNVLFGMVPDTLLQYFDSAYRHLKSDTTILKQTIPCDDCSCVAVMIKKGRDSITGMSCEWPGDPGHLLALKTRIDSFIKGKRSESMYGFIYFPTRSMIIPPPPKIETDK